jgi:hypothetical protein
MSDPALVFERVAIRYVSEIVQKRRNTDENLLVSRNGCAAANGIQHAMCHPGGTQRMFEARVNSRRENQICRTQLSDPPQTLEFGSVHQLHFKRRHFHVAVDGIADEFSSSHGQSCYIGG